MTRYAATIQHHSISRARVIDAGDTLTAAKRAASVEFGTDQQDYSIVIIDRQAESPFAVVVARKRVGAPRWT